MQVLKESIGTVLHLTLWLGLLAAVFVPLERFFALRPRPTCRPGMVVDLACYFVSGLVPSLLLALPAALMTTAARSVVPADWLGSVAALPLWGRLGLTFVVGEVGGYWGHRMAHGVPWLWRFHAVHHSAPRLDWLVHTRAHPIDLAFVRLCAMLPLFLLGLAQPGGSGVGGAAAAQVVSTFWGFLIHANVRWRFGALERVVALPAFHHWHHVRSGPTNRNFATLLPCIDRVFGTLYLPPGWPADYGLDTPSPQRPAARSPPAARVSDASELAT